MESFEIPIFKREVVPGYSAYLKDLRGETAAFGIWQAKFACRNKEKADEAARQLIKVHVTCSTRSILVCMVAVKVVCDVIDCQ